MKSQHNSLERKAGLILELSLYVRVFATARKNTDQLIRSHPKLYAPDGWGLSNSTGRLPVVIGLRVASGA
jgi:hypothetical protein